MFVTNNLIDSFFDDTFAIKRMNEKFLSKG